LKISGTYRLPFPPEQSYSKLQDPELLARTIPGCESLEKMGEDEYRMKMKMALAAVSGAFEGKVRIADRNPPSSFRLIVEGSGKIGSMKGEGLLTFSAADSGTDVTYDGSVDVGGPIAAVGQRLIDPTSKAMIRKFFERVEQAV
jgi:carbon monoxide dehydrogenase subunit G